MFFKNLLLVILFVFVSLSTVFATDVCKHEYGNVSCRAGVVNQVITDGVVTLNDIVVKCDTKINGYISAKNSTFSNFYINGSVNLTKCIIKSDAEIKGSLSAVSTRFNSSLNVYSNSINLVNTKVAGDLHFLYTKAKKQRLHLDNLSIISGNVIFDDKEGEVILSTGSKIKGAIIGGHLITK